jgi:hypothetical protein
MSALLAQLRGLYGRTIGMVALILLAVLVTFWISVREQQQTQAELTALSIDSLRKMAGEGIERRGEAIARLLG